MPLRPRNTHPIRDIRSILGKTQPQFAALVGTSAITIKRIENGTLALSDKLAARIWAATGAMQIELLQGAKGRALSPGGTPYTLETFHRWAAVWNHTTQETALDRAKELSGFVELLCSAAAGGRKSSLRSVYTALATAVDEVCRDYGLDTKVTRLFETKGVITRSLPKGGEAFVVNPSLSLLMENAYYRLGKPNPYSVTTDSLLHTGRRC